jgi:UDP-N-acetylmuramoyl-tripeptide--D-alanyl-D-alanine ligase
MPLSRTHIAEGLSGARSWGHEGSSFETVFTDTRVQAEGGLFVALSGPNHDAHQYLDQALARGAKGLIVSREEALPADLPEDTFVAIVPDTRRALGDLGALVRARHKGRVVAITGSVGKTTVKDMAVAALGAFGSCGRSPGNWNNEIGVPLSLFALDGSEDHVVLELGMSAPGEIGSLTTMVQPNVGLVTTAAAAHLEFFESVDAIADAKAELYGALPAHGIAVVCADDERMRARAAAFAGKGLITYGLDESADLRVTTAELSAGGLTTTIDVLGKTVRLTSRALGRHNAVNAAGALAIVHALGLDVAKAADALGRDFTPSAHRLVLLEGATGVRVLDDSYNANPTSTAAALRTLEEIAPGAPRIAVLGSMLELGPRSAELHREIGALAASTGIQWLGTTGIYAGDLLAGAQSAGLASGQAAQDATDLIETLTQRVGPGHWVLLKGSRSERLERLLTHLGIAEGGGKA